jgi:hypothetical protein
MKLRGQCYVSTVSTSWAERFVDFMAVLGVVLKPKIPVPLAETESHYRIFKTPALFTEVHLFKPWPDTSLC